MNYYFLHNTKNLAYFARLKEQQMLKILSSTLQNLLSEMERKHLMVASAGAGHVGSGMLLGKRVDEPVPPTDYWIVAVISFAGSLTAFGSEQAAYADELLAALFAAAAADAEWNYQYLHVGDIGQAAETALIAVSAYLHFQNFANQ